jgi:hypothetical protein
MSGPVEVNEKQRAAFAALAPDSWLSVIWGCRSLWDRGVRGDPSLMAIRNPHCLEWQPVSASSSNVQVTAEELERHSGIVFSFRP